MKKMIMAVWSAIWSVFQMRRIKMLVNKDRSAMLRATRSSQNERSEPEATQVSPDERRRIQRQNKRVFKAIPGGRLDPVVVRICTRRAA